jgi:hypothetical protein
MWPFSEMSLSAASLVGTIANWVLLASLIGGLLSTFVIVKTTDVKEEHWAEDRRKSNEKIADLGMRGDEAKAELGVAQADIAKANAQAALQVKETAKARQAIVEANARAAEANSRALEAQLALEKFKQPRLLSEQQMSAISEKLKRFAGTKFDCAVIPGDPEAMIFLSHIAATLEKAGWVWVEWTAPEGQIAMTYTIPSKPSIGQLGFLGVTLQINPAHAGPLSAPADALGLALIAEGVEATLDVIDNASVPKKETVHVIVGKKRQ